MSGLTPTQFSVLKFVSDPVRDEPVNVAVIARGGERYQIRALEAFSRLRSVLEADDLDSLATGLRFLRSSLDRTSDLNFADLVGRYGGRIKFWTTHGASAGDPPAI